MKDTRNRASASLRSSNKYKTPFRQTRSASRQTRSASSQTRSPSSPTQNQNIKTSAKDVYIKKYSKYVRINFTKGNPTEELQYQYKLQELGIAPKVAIISDNNSTYKLDEFLSKQIPITPTTNFYYEAVLCGKNIFNPKYGDYHAIFGECRSFFYKIANLALLILSDMKNGNLCRDPITGDLKAIDFEPRFIVNIESLNDKIKESYIIFMLFQLYISLIFYGTRPLIQFSETNISKVEFNQMLHDLVATRRTNPCLRNLYHYSGLLLAGDDIYNTMMAQPPDKAVAFTKELIQDQINGVRPDIDTSFLHLCTSKTPTKSADLSDKGNSYHALEKCEGVNDDTASTQITQGAGKRRFTRKQKVPSAK
jgi:hypothetical protein